MAPRQVGRAYQTESRELPVRLYPATSASERISFNQLQKDTHKPDQHEARRSGARPRRAFGPVKATNTKTRNTSSSRLGSGKRRIESNAHHEHRGVVDAVPVDVI